jgi:hypothetical protein
MNWIKRKRESEVQNEKKRQLEEDRQLLLREIREAHLNWSLAHHHLNEVVEKDEIDYAIFALEAAEKRYSMLLKQAKRLRIVATEPVMNKVVGQ